MKNKVLYWPGIDQGTVILKDMLCEIENNGIQIERIDFEYDKGKLDPNKWNQVINNDSDWWIGLSLGASLLYYVYNFLPKEKRPSRITLINPFSSREIIAIEKGFDINKYWNFAPIDNICNIENVELILSIFDKSIEIYHGIELINNTISKNKNIIFLNSDHTISNDEVQKEIGHILCTYREGFYEYEEKLNYCNIYKQL